MSPLPAAFPGCCFRLHVSLLVGVAGPCTPTQVCVYWGCHCDSSHMSKEKVQGALDPRMPTQPSFLLHGPSPEQPQCLGAELCRARFLSQLCHPLAVLFVVDPTPPPPPGC